MYLLIFFAGVARQFVLHSSTCQTPFERDLGIGTSTHSLQDAKVRDQNDMRGDACKLRMNCYGGSWPRQSPELQAQRGISYF